MKKVSEAYVLHVRTKYLPREAIGLLPFTKYLYSYLAKQFISTSYIDLDLGLVAPSTNAT